MLLDVVVMTEELLDVRGEECPDPVIKVARLLEEKIGSDEGCLIRVLTDNEDCVNYIRDLLNSIDLRDFSVEKVDDYFEIRITV